MIFKHKAFGHNMKEITIKEFDEDESSPLRDGKIYFNLFIDGLNTGFFSILPNKDDQNKYQIVFLFDATNNIELYRNVKDLESLLKAHMGNKDLILYNEEYCTN